MSEKRKIGNYELLPCPCCGTYPNVRESFSAMIGHGESLYRILIKCPNKDCGISLSKTDHDLPDRIWNNRVVITE